MNRLEEAEILVKINKRIKEKAFDKSIGYKPMDTTLAPGEYMEYGFITGQQELIEALLEEGVVDIHKIKRFFNDA